MGGVTCWRRSRLTGLEEERKPGLPSTVAHAQIGPCGRWRASQPTRSTSTVCGMIAYEKPFEKSGTGLQSSRLRGGAHATAEAQASVHRMTTATPGRRS